jgi:hypothetical protein
MTFGAVTLDWPAAILIMFVIVALGVARGGPTRRRHALEMAETKARANVEYQALAGKFGALAQETREAQATLQADLAAVRVSVSSIEAMMREVS